MYDVIIGGGGITAIFTAYVLSFVTNLRVLVIEKYKEVATVNSDTEQNAQSIHGGPEETNFGFAKVMMMRICEMILSAFLETFGTEGKTFIRLPKMAFAVGEKEVEELWQRFEMLKQYFPTLEFLSREDLKQREPVLIEGRNPTIPIAAMGRKNGKATDYHQTTCILERETRARTKNIEFIFEAEIRQVIKHPDHFEINTNRGTYRSKIFIAATGAYSLGFANNIKNIDAKDKDGELAKDFVALPVAGSFYKASRLIYPLNSKVYPMQDPMFPFARPHADPAVHNPNILRFGPTAKWIPLMERYHRETFRDYLRSGILTRRGIISSFGLLNNRKMINFMAKNMFYDFPVLGKQSFLKNAAQHIIPTLKLEDLEFIRGDGGLRPQLLNVRTGQLQMGTGKFFAENFIADHTPSPGASSSGYNGVVNAKHVVRWLGSKYFFDEMAFYETIRLKEYPIISID